MKEHVYNNHFCEVLNSNIHDFQKGFGIKLEHKNIIFEWIDTGISSDLDTCICGQKDEVCLIQKVIKQSREIYGMRR